MINLIQRASDRLVGLVVPKVDVQAPPCNCTPGEQWWGAHCYCIGTAGYKRWYTCQLDCVTATYYCKYAGQYCIP